MTGSARRCDRGGRRDVPRCRGGTSRRRPDKLFDNSMTSLYITDRSFEIEEDMAYQRDTSHPPTRDATPEREVRPVPTGSEIVQLIGRLQDLRGFRDQH